MYDLYCARLERKPKTYWRTLSTLAVFITSKGVNGLRKEGTGCGDDEGESSRGRYRGRPIAKGEVLAVFGKRASCVMCLPYVALGHNIKCDKLTLERNTT